MALTVVDQGLLSSTAQYTGFKNRLINSAMVIDQRNAGASVSVGNSNTYVVDRFVVRVGTGSSSTAARSTDAPAGFKNSLAVTIGTGGTPAAGDGINYLLQWIEGQNVYDLGFGAAGASTITISFWVKSSLTGQFGASLVNYSITRSYPFAYTISSANTWEYKTVTISGDTSGSWPTDSNGWGGIIFDLGNGANYLGTAGAWASADYRGATGDVKVVSTSGATFKITGVQLEKGSTATSFDYRPYGTELQLCQRYYQLITNFQISFLSSSAGWAGVTFPVAMRSGPSAPTIVGTMNVANLYGTNPTISSPVLYGGGFPTGATMNFTLTGATGSIVAGGSSPTYPGTASSGFAFSAEL